MIDYKTNIRKFFALTTYENEEQNKETSHTFLTTLVKD
jgi:hypothetical protein